MRSLLWATVFYFSLCGACASSAPLLPAFTDADLGALLKKSAAEKHNRFLVLTWSPHMVLSQRAVSQALIEAREKRAVVTVLLDPAADSSLAARIIQEQGWPKEALRPIDSGELIQRGFRIHYPTYLFVEGGKILGSVPGFKTRSQLEYFRQRFAK